MKQNELSFKEAFLFPFNRLKGMLNILWILLPIIGWFLLIGYYVKIINQFLKGNFKKLPKLESGDFKIGFFMFLKGIPFIIFLMLIVGIFNYLFERNIAMIIVDLILLFTFPILSINFIKKQTVSSFFEFNLIKFVFFNFFDYIITIIKSIILGILWIFLILFLVGIPGLQFTKNIFFADFYRRNVK